MLRTARGRQLNGRCAARPEQAAFRCRARQACGKRAISDLAATNQGRCYVPANPLASSPYGHMRLAMKNRPNFETFEGGEPNSVSDAATKRYGTNWVLSPNFSRKRLVPAFQPEPRESAQAPPGVCPKIKNEPEDFDDPLPPDALASFYGGGPLLGRKRRSKSR